MKSNRAAPRAIRRGVLAHKKDAAAPAREVVAFNGTLFVFREMPSDRAHDHAALGHLAWDTATVGCVLAQRVGGAMSRKRLTS
jgi:hypothetical protein